MSAPWMRVDGGVQLAVQVAPGARQSSVEGVILGVDGKSALKIRINAPPVEGAANTALIAYLAKALAIRKQAISLKSGATSRHKLLIISGDGTALEETLALMVSPPQAA